MGDDGVESVWKVKGMDTQDIRARRLRRRQERRAARVMGRVAGLDAKARLQYFLMKAVAVEKARMNAHPDSLKTLSISALERLMASQGDTDHLRGSGSCSSTSSGGGTESSGNSTSSSSSSMDPESSSDGGRVSGFGQKDGGRRSGRFALFDESVDDFEKRREKEADTEAERKKLQAAEAKRVSRLRKRKARRVHGMKRAEKQRAIDAEWSLLMKEVMKRVRSRKHSNNPFFFEPSGRLLEVDARGVKTIATRPFQLPDKRAAPTKKGVRVTGGDPAARRIYTQPALELAEIFLPSSTSSLSNTLPPLEARH